MSADEQVPTSVETSVVAPGAEQERSEKILKAKELYSHGSRSFLVKSYAEAADELSQVCALYEELYGPLSDEIGMPYLLYAKSLIALAVDENKVIDVPDEEEDDDDDDEVDDDDDGAGAADDAVEAKPSTSSTVANGSAAAAAKLQPIAEKSTNEVDSTESSVDAKDKAVSTTEKASEEAQVSSTIDEKDKPVASSSAPSSSSASSSAVVSTPVIDGEKPSTSNGADAENVDDEEDEAASTLQLAWEILELAGKVFSRQGASGLANLAEVQTELGNIEFENNILDAARDDYVKALEIYSKLPTNYRRAMAEINYKIGLTYLMQQLNTEGAESLKKACKLIESEIEEINKSGELTEKDKNNIQDMEETKQEIWAKIAEIEETQAQNIAEVRAALDSYIKPISSEIANGSIKSHSVGAAASSSSSSSTAKSEPFSAGADISSSSKPNDISHLIKRKKADDPGSEAEAAASSPAKRPAL